MTVTSNECHTTRGHPVLCFRRGGQVKCSNQHRYQRNASPGGSGLSAATFAANACHLFSNRASNEPSKENAANCSSAFISIEQALLLNGITITFALDRFSMSTQMSFCVKYGFCKRAPLTQFLFYHRGRCPKVAFSWIPAHKLYNMSQRQILGRTLRIHTSNLD